MARHGSSGWNGAYGDEETARRDAYDRVAGDVVKFPAPAGSAKRLIQNMTPEDRLKASQELQEKLYPIKK